MGTFKRLATATAAAIVSLAIAAAGHRVHATESAPPLALQRVMQQLDRDMQDISGAIAIEDWAAVTRLAPKISSHPDLPLAEKMRILAWLGGNAGKFRGFDDQVHEAGLAMGEAASRHDGKAVVAAFNRTQLGCLACHQDFRASFKQHFHSVR